MHDLNSTNSGNIANEGSVRSVWNSLAPESRTRVIGHEGGNDAGIDYISAGMDNYPTELDYSNESAYQQDFSRKLTSYSKSNYDSLPLSVKEYISEALEDQGYPVNEEESTTSTSETYCDKCDMDLGTEEDLNVHDDSLHDDVKDVDKGEEAYDYFISNAESEGVSEESLKEARRILKLTESDFVGFPRELEELEDIGAPTKHEPEDVKGRVGMNYNPNNSLGNNTVVFNSGSAKNRGGTTKLTEENILPGEIFIGETLFKTFNNRERDEATFGIYPSRIYDYYNITSGVETFLTEKSREALEILKATEQDKELTCPYCDSKFEDKVELDHHRKDHVESHIPSFLTDPITDEEDKVGSAPKKKGKIFAPAAGEGGVGSGRKPEGGTAEDDKVEFKKYWGDVPDDEKDETVSFKKYWGNTKGDEGESEAWKEATINSVSDTKSSIEEVEDKVPEFLKGVDFTEDKEKVGESYTYVSNEDIENAIVEKDEVPDGYDEDDTREKENLKEIIIESKLNAYPTHSIIRQVELNSHLTRDAAEVLVNSTEVPGLDYESYSIFHKRYRDLTAQEVTEMKLYGGEAMAEASESYKRDSKW